MDFCKIKASLFYLTSSRLTGATGSPVSNKQLIAGPSGAHLKSQHTGGRGRQIPEFKSILIYIQSPKPASAT